MAVAEEENVDVEVVLYMKNPPDQETLEHIVSVLEDPVEDLVRKDSKFKDPNGDKLILSVINQVCTYGGKG